MGHRTETAETVKTMHEKQNIEDCLWFIIKVQGKASLIAL